MTSHVNRKHARFSPSGSKRAIMCPGSIRMQEGLPNTSSVFADEGTAAHELAEHCLKTGSDPDEFLGMYVNLGAAEADMVSDEPIGDRSFRVDDEMVDGVQTYINTCMEVVNSASGELEFAFEQWVDLSNIAGMEGGTADFASYDPVTKRLTVIDLKYGKGTPVEVPENTQLLCYALGVVNRYHNRGIGDVELIVVQPRCPHAKGPVRRWETDAVTLLEFEHDLAAAALATEAPDAPLVAGEWCKFCKAEAFCEAKRARVLDIASAEFGPYDDQPTLPVVTQMSPDELARVLRLRHEIASWMARVDEFAHAEAAHGRNPTGFKLVAKRATRKWRDEAEAAAKLVEIDLLDIWTEPKLLSPAKIEPKMPGKNKAERAKALEALTVKESSGSVLAPEEDPRPAIKAGVEEFAG
jgi:hypothetical protein